MNSLKVRWFLYGCTACSALVLALGARIEKQETGSIFGHLKYEMQNMP